MSMLSAQSDELRSLADELRNIYEHNVDWLHGEAITLTSSVDAMREAADTIDGLRQKVEDLEGMIGELPPEGKCAMLLVKQVDGEYVWDCERYDFASYCLVDSEADTYTGMTLNDPFGRADFADKLTMAKELRKIAAGLDAQGDILGILTDSDAFGQKLSESRYSELFGTPERAARTLITTFVICGDPDSYCDKCPLRKAPSCSSNLDDDDYDALLEWLEQEVDA